MSASAGQHLVKVGMWPGLAISSFGEAGLPLDASGHPLHPIIAWYDRRCEPQVGWWEETFPAARLHAITGQQISTTLGMNKWMWLRDNRPDLAKQAADWAVRAGLHSVAADRHQGHGSQHSLAHRVVRSKPA